MSGHGGERRILFSLHPPCPFLAPCDSDFWTLEPHPKLKTRIQGSQKPLAVLRTYFSLILHLLFPFLTQKKKKTKVGVWVESMKCVYSCICVYVHACEVCMCELICIHAPDLPLPPPPSLSFCWGRACSNDNYNMLGEGYVPSTLLGAFHD